MTVSPNRFFNSPKLKTKISSSWISESTSGIYESLRVYEGTCFHLEEHLNRFFESAKTLGLTVPLRRPELIQKIEKEILASGKKEAFVRLTLMNGVGAPLVGAHSQDEGQAPGLPLLSIIVAERTHPPEIYREGVVLKTSAVRRSPSQAAFPEAKSTACLNQVLAALDPMPARTYEILFLNQEGYLTEVRIGNFFIVTRGGAHCNAPLLITPPPLGLLNGVPRRFVIECARLGKIPVEERPLMRHELFNAEEAFLTNTSWEVLPIREVDGRRIGKKFPGPVTQKLQLLFHEGVRREMRKVRHGKS